MISKRWVLWSNFVAELPNHVSLELRLNLNSSDYLLLLGTGTDNKGIENVQWKMSVSVRHIKISQVT